MLTLKTLEEMEPHTIFKFTGGKNSERTFMFVAKKGGVNDWAIYTTINAVPFVDFWVTDKNEIAKHGQKLHDEDLIRQLIPCTDEVFSKYRH